MKPFTAEDIIAVLFYKEPPKLEPVEPELPEEPERTGLSAAFDFALNLLKHTPELVTKEAPRLAADMMAPSEDRSFRRARGVFRTQGFTDQQIDVFLSIIQSTIHNFMPCSVTRDTRMDESNFLGVPDFGCDGSGLGFSGDPPEGRQVQEKIVRSRVLAAFDLYYREHEHALTPGAVSQLDVVTLGPKPPA